MSVILQPGQSPSGTSEIALAKEGGFDVIFGLLPEVQVNGWHRGMSFLTSLLGKIVQMAGAAYASRGLPHSVHKCF